MRRTISRLALVFATATAASIAVGAVPEPFAFLTARVRIDATDHGRLDAGKAVVKVLPGARRELAVVAAMRISAAPDRLLTWTSEIAALQQGKYVPLIVRFSDPPRIEDLDGLALDDEDLDDLRQCRPGDCGIKLGADDMVRLQRHMDEGPGWRHRVQREFRHIVLDRVQAYLASGDVGLPPYYDDKTPIIPTVEFAALIEELALTPHNLAGLTEYLQNYPRETHPEVIESFVYWARETLGGARPIASVTHVALLRSDTPGSPPALVISKQVFATHYRDASVSVSAITESEAGQYLVYANRSHVDTLQGLFGGLVRRIIERRVRDEAPGVLNALRVRLEGGDPP
jgi:hypothetical protein